MARKTRYDTLNVRKDIKDLIKSLMHDNPDMDYNKVMEYLLVKAGHLQADQCLNNIAFVERIINGGK